MRRATLTFAALAVGCAHAVAHVDASDPSRVRMGCVRFAVPGGWEIRDTTAETVVLQPAGGARDGDMITIDSESNQGQRLEEWVNATTNEGNMPPGLAYHETKVRGERAWLAESKDTPLQYFVIEAGGRFFHFRKLRGDKASFEKLWRSIELEGCSS